MDGERLLFSLSVCVFSVLVCVVLVAGRGDDQRSSSITSPEEELDIESRPESEGGDFITPPHPQPASATPPYLLLPMFHHQSSPALSKHLFSPVSGRTAVPRPVTDLLIPQGLGPYIRVTPINNDHGVEVWCGDTEITVRIDQERLNFRSDAAHFRLGTCPATRADRQVLYFRYELNECGGSLSVANGQLLYANKVLYRPERQRSVLRAMPLMLPVQCVYDRFHYSYKIGYLPEFRPQSFRKTMVKKRVFSLSVRDGNWQELGLNHSVVLGDPVYFEVATRMISKDKSVYVEACHVTSSEDYNSTQRYDIISNFGCMVDSKRTGSQSRYVSRQRNILRFSLDAFLFSEATSERFYLHCTVLVGNVTASATAKSCTYSESERRWAELKGHASVCRCCDSDCRPSGFNSWSSVQQVVVSSKPWSLIHNKVSLEASEELDTVSGSILLHHLHHAKGEESQEEEELCVGEELEEEIVMGVVESGEEEENEMLSDQGIEEGDMVKEKKEEVKVGEGQKEKVSLQKNLRGSWRKQGKMRH